MSYKTFMRRPAVVSTLLVVGLVGSISAAPALAQSADASAAPAGSSAPATAALMPGDAGFVAGTPEAPRHIAMTLDDHLLFNPNVITIAEGETIQFDLTNVGAATHEFKVGPMADAFGDTEGAPEVADIEQGQTVSLTYTFEGPGPFAFACHEPGHFEHDMIGFVMVIGPDVPAVGTVDAPRQVLIQMNDKLEFIPNDVDVAPGETIRFILQNLGEATHEFQLGDAAMTAADQVDGSKVVEVDSIDAHHVADVTYTFAPGDTYSFACHEPGHYENGMKGTITFTS